MRTDKVLLLWCVAMVVALEEGDNCTGLIGQNGKCINVHNCPYAKDLLQKRQNPGICGFQGTNPLVCCIDVTFSLKSQHGSISAEKCKEYYPYKKYFLLVPGAKPSVTKEFPHMAIIGFGEKDDIQWQCGGSLISANFILTAAHCLRSTELGDAKFVRLGDLDLATDTDEADPQDFTVKRLIPHPEFKRPSRYHDIGLIELDKPVKFTQFVAIACLDTRREHNETQMLATGWGRTEFIGSTSSILLKAFFNIVPHNVCTPYYASIPQSLLGFGIVDDFQVCAGGGTEQDTCQGDSGGPLQVLNTERSSSIKVYDIVGLTSFGKACGLSDSPGIYTRVYNYLPWIESIVWPLS